MEKDELLKISELADFFGTTPKALRLYEKKGIIIPSKVDPLTGYRYYSVDQVKKLNVLVELQELGFSLNEIKKIMKGGLKSQGFLDSLYSKKVEWEQKKNELQKKIDAIETIEQNLSRKIGSTEITAMTEEERAWFLLNVVCVEELKATKVLSEAIWL
ncbi:MAG: MerR family transcriptional regulator [Spirochaetaceae bacterium]|nr:MerR family transcriptional regulator [Spirochaetaceae bacterium]MBO4705536.1 MerR family transcriptional regulator [Spirochaetaceae bacterium]